SAASRSPPLYTRACARPPRTPAGLWPRTWLVMSEQAKHEAVQLVRFAGVERGEYRRGALVQEHLGLAQPGRGEVLSAEPADHCREPGELVGLPVSQGRGRRRLPGLGFWSHSPTVTRIGWYHH